MSCSRGLPVAALLALGGLGALVAPAGGTAAWAAGAGTPAVAVRVVALSPHLAELMYTVGAGTQLVGTVEYSDIPAAARTVPRIGDALRVDVERLFALRPDLVLAWESGTPAAVIGRLASLGMRVVTVPTYGIDDVGQALRTVGRLTGHDTEADAVASTFEAAIAERRRRFGERTPLSVFIEIDDQPLYTVNGQQLISQVVTLCGGRNIFAALDQLAPAIGIEPVIAANPQVILSTDDTAVPAAERWQRWPGITAVDRRHVYTLIADDVARPTTRLVAGIDQVCGLLDKARMPMR